MLKLAEELRHAAERQMLSDPYANPYYPTTASVRTLLSRIANAAEREVRAAMPLDDPELEDKVRDARLDAPRRAMEQLKYRAQRAQREERELREERRRVEQRHDRRQRDAVRDREALRAGKSLGQRLDDAIAGLTVLAAAPAANIQGDRVHGGEHSGKMPWTGDPAGYATERAHKLVLHLEHVWDTTRTRQVQGAA